MILLRKHVSLLHPEYRDWGDRQAPYAVGRVVTPEMFSSTWWYPLHTRWDPEPVLGGGIHGWPWFSAAVNFTEDLGQGRWSDPDDPRFDWVVALARADRAVWIPQGFPAPAPYSPGTQRTHVKVPAVLVLAHHLTHREALRVAEAQQDREIRGELDSELDRLG